MGENTLLSHLHCCRSGLDKSLLEGQLAHLRVLTTALASHCSMPAAPPLLVVRTKNVSKHNQMSSGNIRTTVLRTHTVKCLVLKVHIYNPFSNDSQKQAHRERMKKQMGQNIKSWWVCIWGEGWTVPAISSVRRLPSAIIRLWFCFPLHSFSHMCTGDFSRGYMTLQDIIREMWQQWTVLP